MKMKTFLLLLAALVCLPATSVYAGDDNPDDPAISCVKCGDCTFIYNYALLRYKCPMDATQVELACQELQGGCCNPTAQTVSNCKCTYDTLDLILKYGTYYLEILAEVMKSIIGICEIFKYL